MRGDRVYKRGGTEGGHDSSAAEILEKIDAPRGRVDGQILRGSVLADAQGAGPEGAHEFRGSGGFGHRLPRRA